MTATSERPRGMSQTRLVFERLRTAIVEGRLLPSSKLNIAALAEELVAALVPRRKAGKVLVWPEGRRSGRDVLSYPTLRLRLSGATQRGTDSDRSAEHWHYAQG